MCGAIKTKSSALFQCFVKSSRKICGYNFYALIQNCIGERYKKAESNMGKLIWKLKKFLSFLVLPGHN